MENRIAEIKSYIRDLNLEVLTHTHDFKIDINRRYCNNTMKFLMPSRKLIRFITESGGVLVGSRAIRCYSIGSMSMLDRSSKDWDFVVTKSQAFKICERPDYTEIDGVRISEFSSNVSEKIALIDSLSIKSDEVEKHIADMTQLIIKFNCLK